MPEHAKTSGYTPALVAALLKTHPMKGDRRSSSFRRLGVFCGRNNVVFKDSGRKSVRRCHPTVDDQVCCAMRNARLDEESASHFMVADEAGVAGSFF